MVKYYKCPNCSNSLERYMEFSCWYDCKQCNIEIWIGEHKIAIYQDGLQDAIVIGSNFEECYKKFKLRALC